MPWVTWIFSGAGPLKILDKVVARRGREGSTASLAQVWVAPNSLQACRSED
jgi:hypothetical protein